MPRVPRSRRDGEEKCSGLNPAAVQTNGKIDFAQISNILEGAVDVLGNDKSKLATLENLLKTALEKVAQKKKIFLPPPKFLITLLINTRLIGLHVQLQQQCVSLTLCCLCLEGFWHCIFVRLLF